MDQKIAKRWVVSGRVQGVGFRFFVQHQAMALGVAGWIRNLADGRVEAYAVGSSKALSDLSTVMRTGPRMANVRSVEEHDAAPEPVSGFAIR